MKKIRPLVQSLDAVTQELATKQLENLRIAWRKEYSLPKLKIVMDTVAAFKTFVAHQDLTDDFKDDLTAEYLRGERKLGGLWHERPKAKSLGDNQYQKVDRFQKGTEAPPTLAELGLDRKRAARNLAFNDVEEDFFEERIARRRADHDLSVSGVYLDVRQELARRGLKDRLKQISEAEADDCDGVFDVLVIDPPWPMQKFPRDVRPDQAGELDYPIMSETELLAWTFVREKAGPDCHVFLWTTHKCLPLAFRCLEQWAAKYICTFVWHKPGGIQPLNFPQLNCEFCLYGRYGNPQFIDTTAFNACFEAPRGNHSEKPEEFYEVLRRVTAGRRLDMFNRRKIDGFAGWGNEAK